MYRSFKIVASDHEDLFRTHRTHISCTHTRTAIRYICACLLYMQASSKGMGFTWFARDVPSKMELKNLCIVSGFRLSAAYARTLHSNYLQFFKINTKWFDVDIISLHKE